MSELLPEWAFYYPNPVWSQSNWLKNLLLFFDGVVMLAPEFARERPFEADSEIAQRLQDAGLLKVVELKSFVDSKGVRVVADALTELIAGGSLDQLAARPTEFHALSYSQLGYMTDGGLAEIIYEGLHARGVGAQGPQGTGSWHPTVRSLLLVLLAQVLRPAGRKQGMYLCPATDRRELHSALIEVIVCRRWRRRPTSSRSTFSRLVSISPMCQSRTCCATGIPTATRIAGSPGTCGVSSTRRSTRHSRTSRRRCSNGSCG